MAEGQSAGVSAVRKLSFAFLPRTVVPDRALLPRRSIGAAALRVPLLLIAFLVLPRRHANRPVSPALSSRSNAKKEGDSPRDRRCRGAGTSARGAKGKENGKEGWKERDGCKSGGQLAFSVSQSTEGKKTSAEREMPFRVSSFSPRARYDGISAGLEGGHREKSRGRWRDGLRVRR